MKIGPLILCLGVKSDRDRKMQHGLRFLDGKIGNCECELLSQEALHLNGRTGSATPLKEGGLLAVFHRFN